MKYIIEPFEEWKKAPGKASYKFAVESDRWTFIELKKGITAGKHFHKGNAKKKNPEEIIIIKGKGEFLFRDLETGKEEKVVVESPVIVKIYPNVYHELKALEDCYFIEPYSEEGLNDVFDENNKQIIY